MGDKLTARKDLIVVIDPAFVLASDLQVPGPNLKFVMLVVPTVAGTIKRVFRDGPIGFVEEREGILNQGNPLVVGERNVVEFSAPPFYQFGTDPIFVNFRYSANATFTIFTVYAEKEHAATFLTGP